jgi:hypothetical protein
MSALREKIVEIAREEASPPPHGKVSDLVLDGNGHRAGWPRLKQYFDEAVEGWLANPRQWEGRGEIKLTPSSPTSTILYLDGIRKPLHRVPQGTSKISGISWCGIFATWVLQQAGLKKAKWVNSVGISGNGVSRVDGRDGIQVGDVIVIRGGEVHHAIVAELPSIYDEDAVGNLDTSIVTINGNSTNQSIRIHSEYRLQDVSYFYKVPDAV